MLFRSGNKQLLEFYQKEEEATAPEYSKPSGYLYEPNAAVMKAGAFRLLTKKFTVAKLAASTQLYTSENLVEDFPGRAFKIIGKLEKKDRDVQANVISRNHPLSAEQIRKKFNIRDGGDKFVIGFSSQEEKHIMLTTRIY